MYVAIFLAAVVVCFVGVPLCSRLEDRADERDRQAFADMYGTKR